MPCTTTFAAFVTSSPLGLGSSQSSSVSASESVYSILLVESSVSSCDVGGVSDLGQTRTLHVSEHYDRIFSKSTIIGPESIVWEELTLVSLMVVIFFYYV